MTNFAWEPLDFLDVLSVIPAVEEYGISYHYEVEREPLRLDLTVWPLDGDVELTIHCKGMSQPVVLLSLLDCPGARVKVDKRGKYIEFSAANIFSGRYDNTRPAPYGFQLWIEPQLQVTTFSYDV